MLRTFLIGCAVAMLLAAGPVFAQTGKAPPEQMTEPAQGFVTKVAQVGLLESASGKFAADRAKHAELKNLARQIVEEQERINAELSQIATKAGLTFPGGMSDAQQSKFVQLKATSDSAFDGAYLEALVVTHREAKSLLVTYARSGDSADLKTFAAKTLPLIEEREATVHRLSQTSAAGRAKRPMESLSQ